VSVTGYALVEVVYVEAVYAVDTPQRIRKVKARILRGR
jgi:hypothetical protein